MEDSAPAQKEWSTSDMYFAAFLRAKGLRLLRHESRPVAGKNQYHFFFAQDLVEGKTIDQWKFSYHNGEATAPAFQLVTQIKAFKNIVHS